MFYTISCHCRWKNSCKAIVTDFMRFYLVQALFLHEKFKMDNVLCLNYLNFDTECILKMFSNKLVSSTDFALEISLITLCYDHVSVRKRKDIRNRRHVLYYTTIQRHNTITCRWCRRQMLVCWQVNLSPHNWPSVLTCDIALCEPSNLRIEVQ